MKRNALPFPSPSSSDVIAEFGSAQLIASALGRLELRGGSSDERAEAREWASLFLDTEYVAWLPATP